MATKKPSTYNGYMSVGLAPESMHSIKIKLARTFGYFAPKYSGKTRATLAQLAMRVSILTWELVVLEDFLGIIVEISFPKSMRWNSQVKERDGKKALYITWKTYVVITDALPIVFLMDAQGTYAFYHLLNKETSLAQGPIANKVTFAAGKHGIVYIWDHRGEKGSEVYQTYKKKELANFVISEKQAALFLLKDSRRKYTAEDGHELNDSNTDDEHELKLRIIAMKIYKTITQTYWQLIQCENCLLLTTGFMLTPVQVRGAEILIKEISFYGIIRDALDSSLATMTKIMVIGSLKQFLQKDKFVQ
ncbi:hypothetical protein ACFE04_022856 [Oxalis oulophora]